MDHEPALGAQAFPISGRWTSGHDLAADVDLLIHDAQYTAEEYRSRPGWGHSSVDHVLAFAELSSVAAWSPSTMIRAMMTTPSMRSTR